MASAQQQQQPRPPPTSTDASPEIDWKRRCEQLQIEYQLELERIHLHYDRELKEKVNEVRRRLKHDYDQQLTRLLEQQQEAPNISSSSFLFDQSIGEQVREQVRLAEEYDRYEDEQHRQLLSQQLTDNDECKRLINKLHTEGVEVLSLSELLSLQMNGVTINPNSSVTKLQEENAHLRSLIANMNNNGNNNALIRCLADIFRCEQERRLSELRERQKDSAIEQEIQHMCDYQRQALGKILSQDRLALIHELEQTKEQLDQLKDHLEHLKRNQSMNINSHHLNRFYLKYLRCEAYRKALIYQKRYLLVLLTGYEDTETYALNEIRRLTGDTKINTSNYDKMKLIPKRAFARRSTNYRFRFRCYVTVVIAMLRMRWLKRKWSRKLATVR